MEKLVEILKKIPGTKLIPSMIVIIAGVLVYKMTIHFFAKSEKHALSNKRMNNKGKTYFRLLNSALRYVIIIVTIILLLQVNGLDVSSMLAGLGIVSVIIGLAVQDALKDIIRGVSILSDNYFSVGDVVTYNNITGKVMVIGLKTTRVQDIATDNVVSIANRNIEEIQIVSKSLYVDFPMPYEVPVDRAEEVVSEIIDDIKQYNDDVEDVLYKGVSELADSSIKYKLKIICAPDKRLQVRRDALRCVLKCLSRNNIDVPYNQIDVHQK